MSGSASSKAEEIFLALQEAAPDDRVDLLREACAGDGTLEAEVRALLDAAIESESFFSDLSRRLGVAELFDEEERATRTPSGIEGMSVGSYRLTRLIGAGGMGTVWQAERSDGRFDGSVAVKLLNLSAGGPAARRFELEGRYLARLTHPSIARLLDAGVLANDQPFLVLEHVDGSPIDRYCDQHELDVEQRLRLFLDVLDAVSHAHSNLIVHRDIKPSNILVAEAGEVKLLDFGVAKLMDAETHDGLTRDFGAALTPTFAAPEQLLGGAITTATDVYSLGLLLYLLLAGVNPRTLLNQDSGPALATLLDTEPPTLSDAVTISPANGTEPAASAAKRGSTVPALQRKLRGDLDRIVRKSLATDTDRRYASVREFADDIRRYLRHEPVTAQADTTVYRLRKFARRHRGGVVAATFVTLALVAATVVTTWQMLEARRQRDFALEQQQLAISVNSFSNMLFEEISDSGEAFTMLELLERGVTALDKRRDRGQPFLNGTYYDLAMHFSNLGQKERAIELLDLTATIAAQQKDADLEARALCSTVNTHVQREPDLARSNLSKGLATSSNQGDGWTLTTKVICARAQAFVYELDGDRETAKQILHRAATYFDESPLGLNNTQAALLGHLGSLYYKDSDYATVLELNEDVLRLLAEDDRDGGMGFLIVSLNQTATLQRVGEVLNATERRRPLLERMRALDIRGGALTGTFSSQAAGLNRLGGYEEVLESLPRYRQQAQDNGDVSGVASIDLQLAKAYIQTGEYSAAHAALDEAQAYYSESGNVNPGALRATQLARFDLYLVEDRFDAARIVVTELLDATGGDQGGMLAGQVRLAAAQLALAERQFDTAEQHSTEAHRIAASIARGPDTSADVGLALLTRAEARLALGNTSEARTDLEAAIPALSNGYGASHVETERTRTLLNNLR